MQFTKAETRMAILEAMGWWFAERPARQPTAPQQPATCAAIASGAAAQAAPLDGVVVSSALANFSLLCLLPGPRDGQRVVLGVEPRPDGALANCPCCWRLDALQRATLADAKAPTALATGAKVLQRASRWTKCRLWRRFA